MVAVVSSVVSFVVSPVMSSVMSIVVRIMMVRVIDESQFQLRLHVLERIIDLDF